MNPSCPACGSPDSKFAFVKSEYSHYSCNSCRSLYVYPRPSRAELNEFYRLRHDYLLSRIAWDDSVSSHRHVLHHWKYILKQCKKLSGCGPLLDIGCGTGRFLQFSKEHGWNDLTGVEIVPGPAKAAHDLSGARIYNQDIFDLTLPSESYACVIILDLIEHVADIQAMLRESFRLLKNGGVIVIGTINLRGLDMRVFGKDAFNVYPPEHLTFFSRKGISQALRSTGFAVKRQWTATIYLREWMRFVPGVTADQRSRDKQYKEIRSNIAKSKILLVMIRFVDYFLRMTDLGDEFYVIAQKPAHR